MLSIYCVHNTLFTALYILIPLTLMALLGIGMNIIILPDKEIGPERVSHLPCITQLSGQVRVQTQSVPSHSFTYPSNEGSIYSKRYHER